MKPIARKDRWVLDTNVLLDWLIFQDMHVRKLVAHIESGQVVLLTRSDCRDEFVRVLDYPQVVKHPEPRALALETYDRWHTMHGTGDVAGRPSALPLCRDPDDQKFLELARDAKADWLITKDRALLELTHRVRLAAGYDVLDPAEAILRLQASSQHTR